MQIQVKAVVVQVSFDQKYTGTVEITIPDHKITRTFNFTLTDPTGNNTRYEVLHNDKPFLTLQAGGDEADLRRQAEALPKGRQLMMPLFFNPIGDGYMAARSNHADPEDRRRHHEMESRLAVFGGSVSYCGEINRDYDSNIPEQADIICRELKTLPATLPQYATAARA